jgi:hypothetical protein
MEFIQLNELQLNKMDDHYMKLKRIFERTIELIDTHHLMKLQLAPFFGKKCAVYARACQGVQWLQVCREIFLY